MWGASGVMCLRMHSHIYIHMNTEVVKILRQVFPYTSMKFVFIFSYNFWVIISAV